jgi:hypothetical protein
MQIKVVNWSQRYLDHENLLTMLNGKATENHKINQSNMNKNIV